MRYGASTPGQLSLADFSHAATAGARELRLELLIRLRRLVVAAQEPFDALVVDGLPVVQALRVPGQQDLDAVAGPLGDLGRVSARACQRSLRSVLIHFLWADDALSRRADRMAARVTAAFC